MLSKFHFQVTWHPRAMSTASEWYCWSSWQAGGRWTRTDQLESTTWWNGLGPFWNKNKDSTAWWIRNLVETSPWKVPRRWPSWLATAWPRIPRTGLWWARWCRFWSLFQTSMIWPLHPACTSPCKHSVVRGLRTPAAAKAWSLRVTSRGTGSTQQGASPMAPMGMLLRTALRLLRTGSRRGPVASSTKVLRPWLVMTTIYKIEGSNWLGDSGMWWCHLLRVRVRPLETL